MTPAEIDRVFGRGRLRMTTGEHVEVFREEARAGEERRYTKRFLETASGDFRPWTEREWRILDRLGERGDAAVARVVRFFPADGSGMARLQTRDAGATVDQWAALVSLRRTAPVLPYVFGDCANWWALARQCLLALEPLHALGFVHLDLKADNLCIPWKPAHAGRPTAGQPLAPDFDRLALIDVAFSLLPEVELPGPLPLAREPGYEYQSPRLLDALAEARRGKLAPTLELDWRCDIFSLAALLWRTLPESDDTAGTGWSSQRHAAATAFVRRLLEIHGDAPATERPHRELIEQAALRLSEPQLAAALQVGSSFDPERAWPKGAEATPLTRVVATLPVGPAAAPRREPSFAASASTVAASAASPVASSAASSVAASGATRGPSAAAPVASSAASSVAAPDASPRVAPVAAPATASASVARASAGAGPAAVATRAATPSARTSTSPTAPAAAPASLVSAVAGGAESPPMAAPAKVPPPRPAPRAATPITAKTATGGQAAPLSTPKPVPAAPARRSAPPLAKPMRPPSSTPLPILAAAGVGAVLVALAAWWGLDGRAMVGRMTERRAAAAPASAALARPAAASPAVVADASLMAAPSRAPASSSGSADAETTAAASAESTAAATPPSAVTAASSASIANAPATTDEPNAGNATISIEPPSDKEDAPATTAFDAAASDWMTSRLPRIAQAGERQLAPVLHAAARATEMRRRGEVRAALQAARSASRGSAPDAIVHVRDARTLNEAALAAYWRDNSVTDAVRLQTQAFGANPLDPEVVGNLAFLRLKEKPPDADAARQLALQALTLKDDRFPSGRIEDWTTLAIADALTGRDADAKNAWFVSMALTSDLQRQCNAAVRAQATYGELLRPSVQAMLQRARSSAAYGRCEVAQSAAQAASGKPGRSQVKSKSKSKSTQRSRRAIP